MDLFKTLAQSAFTLRKGQRIHLVRRIQLLVRHSRYDDRPLEEALRSAFGGNSDMLFPRPPGIRRLRTAVLSTTGTGTVAMLCSNYNAKIRGHSDYVRHRPTSPLWELAVWEA
jgi:hypothetical protein